MDGTKVDIGDTSKKRNNSPHYENVAEIRPKPSLAGLHSPNHRSNQNFQNYADQSPRQTIPEATEQNQYFQPNFQNIVPAAVSYSQPQQFTPDPRVSNYQQEAWTRTLPKQSPQFKENHPTPTPQRRSLDESKNPAFFSREERVSPVANQHFIREHRRGRSDEVARCFEGTPHLPRNPVRFGSPPLVRASPMTHSYSTSSIDQQQHLHQQQLHHPHNVNHPLHHSASMDSASIYNRNENIYLSTQNTKYVNLTTCINKSHRQLRDLEGEKEKLEIELNDLLKVQNNPTEKEYRQMCNEVNHLHRELSEMYNECDKLNISIDPGQRSRQLPPPAAPDFRTPSPIKAPQTQLYTNNKQNPMFPYNNGEHLKPIINKQPLPPPNYRTISDPAPDYDSLKPEGRLSNLQRSISDVPRRPPPPFPRPPFIHPSIGGSNSFQSQPPPTLPNNNNSTVHSMEDEHWECPSCTFKNLLVAECEVCYTPRPKSVTGQHS